MDPSPITGDIWEGLENLVKVVWLLAPLSMVFSASLLISLGVIPSLMSTRELSATAERARGVFYALGVVSGLALVAVLIGSVLASGVIGEFWPRWAI